MADKRDVFSCDLSEISGKRYVEYAISKVVVSRRD